MDNNISHPFADLWPNACLLRAATAVSRPSKHWCTLDIPQKSVPGKADLFTFGSMSVMVN